MSTQTSLSGELLFDVSADTAKAKDEFESLSSTLTRTLSAAYGLLGILRQLGLGEEANEAMETIMKLIMMVNMLVAALNALQVAMAASGAGMITKIAAVVGLTGTAVSVGSFVGSIAEGSQNGVLYNAVMGRQR